MALDPNIILRGAQPLPPVDAAGQLARGAQTVGIFQQLRNEQEMAPLRQAVLQGQATGQALANQQRQAQILEATRQRDLKGLASSYLQVKGAIDAGNYTEAADQLESTIMQKLQAGQTVADMSDTIQAMETLRSNDPDAIAAIKRKGQGIVDAAVAEGLLEDPSAAARAKKFATKSFAPEKDPKTGEFFGFTYDPNSNTFAKVPLGFKGQTRADEIAMEQKAKQMAADLEVSTTKEKEFAKNQAARAKEVGAEISDRYRSAARSGLIINEALALVANSTEGLTASVWSRLAKVVPGIEVGDEGALDSVLKRLALEQLQKFKGPTTDFEFNVTQQIVGQLGDPRSANVARLKSLARNDWFMRREYEQYRKFVDEGGDPDRFAFDINEIVNTKKGRVSLKNIQQIAADNHLTIEETLDRLNR